MTRFIQILLAALIGMLVVLTAYLCLFIETLTRTTAEIPLVLDNAIAREGLLTRASVSEQVEGLTNRADHQVTTIRKDLFSRLDTLESDTFHQVDQIRVDANQQIADTRVAAMAEISKVSTPAGATIESIQAMIPTATHILDNASTTSDLMFDCDHNVDCFFNRYVGASKAIERSAQNLSLMSTDIRLALPTAITTWQSIGTNVNGIAINVNQLSKPKWYDRLIGYGLNGIVIYRNLNPVTSLTVKGAQFIASRP